MKHPSFCIIAPTAYLEQYASQSRTHLTLAHLVENDSIYAEFYRKMSERGDLVIMDCSSFEFLKPYKSEDLVTLGKKCGATHLVLPDYPFQDGAITIEAAVKYIPIFKDAGFKTLFVPQSLHGDMEGWLLTYYWAANNPLIDAIGFSCLGMPNCLPNIPPSYARVVLAQLLLDKKMFNFDKHCHWLGLQNMSLEVPALINMGVVNTLDSSNPVWAALHGHQYSTSCDSALLVKKRLLPPVDFSVPMLDSREVQNVIQHNLDITKDIFTNPHKYL